MTREASPLLTLAALALFMAALVTGLAAIS